MTYTLPEGAAIGTFTANTLPASFCAPADAVVTYKIYGTSAGAGVETGNLFDAEVEQGSFKPNTGIPEDATYRVRTTFSSNPLPAGTYTISVLGASSVVVYAYTSESTDDYSPSDSQTSWQSLPYTFATSKPLFLRFAFSTGKIIVPSDVSNIMLTSGSTAPTTYIPFGYKIPILNTSGEQQSNYDLFIGSTKLGEEEYLDYQEQKIYKMISGVLTPVDPPAPLPPIPTYKGENTLSSTETLGDIELTGDWLAIMGSTEAESIDISFTVDAEEYIAFVTVDEGPSIQVSDTITMPSSADSFSLEVVAWGREQYTDTVYNALS